MLVIQKYLKWLFWLLVIAVSIISCIPGSGNIAANNVDKVAHFFAFFFLSLLLILAYSFSKPFFVTALLMTLFGLAIEILHLYIPNRVFSLYDLAADIFGILAALAVYKIIYFRLKPA